MKGDDRRVYWTAVLSLFESEKREPYMGWLFNSARGGVWLVGLVAVRMSRRNRVGCA
jgi:hypothetical protein